jgi:tryptophanyl-tRNA synthetase
MSKSRDNTLNIFLPEKALRKKVLGIVTDSTALEDPKNPDTCNAFALYALLANEDQIKEMRKKYLAGGFGYGHAKQELFELIMERFAGERRAFEELLADKAGLNEVLAKGATRARSVARGVLERVREKVGF